MNQTTTEPAATGVRDTRAALAAALRQMAAESDKHCRGLEFHGEPPAIALRAGAAALERELREAALLDQVRRLRGFVAWFDVWADSPEHCGGPLFESMLEARGALDDATATAWRSPEEDPPPRQEVIVQWHDPVIGPDAYMELAEKRDGRWYASGEKAPLKQTIDGWQPLPVALRVAR